MAAVAAALLLPAGTAAVELPPPLTPTVPSLTLPDPLSPPPAPLPPPPALPPLAPAPAGPAVAPPGTSPVPATGSGRAQPRAARESPRAGRRPTTRRPAITIAFRVPTARPVVLLVTQVAPVCRSAGALRIDARAGVNRLRFAGRVGGRALRDGTYVVETPSEPVRLAIVGGAPTREREHLEPDVCKRIPVAEANSVAAAPSPPAAPAVSSASAARPERQAELLPDRQGGVLGASFREAVEAGLALHPAFYLLLAVAIAVLGVSSLPAAAVPSPWVGAALARRRIELALLGTLAMLGFLVAYLIALAQLPG